MVIRYFAWLKDHTKCAEETVTCPENVSTIAELITFLCNKSDGHKAAFAHEGVIRVAINQEFASLNDHISAGDEIAFFPPVTGG